MVFLKIYTKTLFQQKKYTQKDASFSICKVVKKVETNNDQPQKYG